MDDILFGISTVTGKPEPLTSTAGVLNVSGLTIGGSSGQVQYNNAGSLGGLATMVVASVGTASETLTYQNPVASTGVTSFIVKGGAANGSGGNPPIFTVKQSDNTMLLEATNLGVFMNRIQVSTEAGYQTVGGEIISNSNGAIDFVTWAPTDSVGHGAFNFEMAANYAITSGTGSYFWCASNAGNGFKPTSGTAVFNGIWLNWPVVQTGGANGITRQLFIDPSTLTAADFRAIEVNNLSGQTAFKTTGSTDLFSLAGKITTYNGITTAGIGSTTVYATSTATGLIAADTNRINYTPPAAAGRYRISWTITPTTSTNHNFHMVGTWKNATGGAVSQTLGGFDKVGTSLVAGAITNTIGAGVYYGSCEFDIDNTQTAITLSTVGTFTTVTYNISATLEQLV